MAEQAIADRSPTSMVRDGLRPEDMLHLLLDGMDPQIMTRQTVPGLAQSCPCCDERVFRTLRLLPRSEVRAEAPLSRRDSPRTPLSPRSRQLLSMPLSMPSRA